MTDFTPDQSAPGYLWVLSEPGKEATEEEFNDWYDSEHVPLRMQHIPEFLSGARYSAADGLYPRYNAAYDISTVALFSNPVYTRLRANRSPREGNLVARLGVLDRRTAQTTYSSGPAAAAKDAPKFVVSIADDAEVQGQGLERVKGWRRSQAHRIYDSLVIGHGKDPVQNKHLPFAAVHEFDTEDFLESDEYKQAIEGKKEVRRWKLYAAYDNTAPKAE